MREQGVLRSSMMHVRHVVIMYICRNIEMTVTVAIIWKLCGLHDWTYHHHCIMPVTVQVFQH